MSKSKFSLISSAILILSSFLPVTQIVLVHLNSFIAQPIGMLFSKNDSVGIYGINGILSSLMFVLFYFSRSFKEKLFSLLGILLFFMPILFYSFEGVISTDKFYFLQFLVIGIVISAIIFAIEIIKYNSSD
jgi:hypothetical protein